LLQCCFFGCFGADAGKFLSCGAGDADGGKVAAQAAQACVVAALLKGQGF
jgi:hypothetical protein